MKSLRLFSVGLTALAALAALTMPAHADVLTFDELSGQATLVDGYGGFNWGGTWTHYGFTQSPYTAHSLEQRIYASPTFATTAEFSFVTDGIFDGFWASGNAVGQTSLSYNLYDTSNTLVASTGVINVTDVPQFLASGYSGTVKRIEVVSASTQGGGNGYFVVDDITYRPKGGTVPEPGTLALLALAIPTGVGIIRRRRSRI